MPLMEKYLNVNTCQMDMYAAWGPEAAVSNPTVSGSTNQWDYTLQTVNLNPIVNRSMQLDCNICVWMQRPPTMVCRRPCQPSRNVLNTASCCDKKEISDSAPTWANGKPTKRLMRSALLTTK